MQHHQQGITRNEEAAHQHPEAAGQKCPMNPLALVLLIGLLYGCGGNASIAVPVVPSPLFTVSGVVTDSVSQLPLADATVSLADARPGFGTPPKPIQTNSSGAYQFSMVRGEIFIGADKAGYAPQMLQRSIVGDTTINFALTPATSPTLGPID